MGHATLYEVTGLAGNMPSRPCPDSSSTLPQHSSQPAPHRLPPGLFFRTSPLTADAAARLGLVSCEGEREQAESVLRLLGEREDVTAWVRNGRGLIGIGRAMTIQAHGASRIDDLRAAWRRVVYASWWRDALVRPGTGPLALGTITFAASSELASALIVPRILCGVDDEGVWITCAASAESELPSLDEALRELEGYRDGPAQSCGVDNQNEQADQATPRPQNERDTAYLAAIDSVQEAMRAGQVRKVVLARDEYIYPSHPLPTGHILRRLAAAYPSCWTFAVDGMIGASPELLVRMHGRHLESRVLAGTARRRNPSDEDERSRLAHWLENSDKNNQEHELARASALQSLQPLCSALQAPPRYVLTLPNVLHLASDIHGVVAGDTGALSLVAALHPTAAVGGTPREEALALIESTEQMDRGRYAGPVGWVDWHGEGEWCIALRSGQIEDTTQAPGPHNPVRIFGGGGIMPESQAQDELAETRAKMRPLRGALGD